MEFKEFREQAGVRLAAISKTSNLSVVSASQLSINLPKFLNFLNFLKLPALSIIY